ncbi:hypothetical protein IQ270_29700 [Microcoleus sp. LEGE 07076]|uniref:hypothetical protein n=1 Tax=Microcoleus sp. LEGE 07076 TaxID=915322 RepID=UPI0018802A1E|nr:hypothetical protein [Microcoleus sp. LEGE 07076]MBE9188692.1 hypothetical protein [Microcoleus sp. LEGE 07076]
MDLFETFFSAYFTFKAPFVVRLIKSDIEIRGRIKVTCYAKKDGRIVKYDFSKKDGHHSAIESGDNIRTIMISGPDATFQSILSPEENPARPWHLGLWYRGYQWKWTPDVQILRAYDGASAFYFKAEEVNEIRAMLVDTSKDTAEL